MANSLPFEIGDIEQTIGERFEQVCRQFPDHPAICFDGEETTYDRLNDYANSIAFDISESGQPLGAGIAILLPQGADLIAAILGVLKSGRFYVPLDPDLPESSLETMCRIAGVGLVLTQRSYSALATRICDSEIRLVEDISRDRSGRTTTIGRDPSSTAYIYFTSGSTGTPKGVFDSHRNVLHNIYRYTTTLGITDRDRMSLLQPPGFSGAVSSLLSALLNGATSCPFDYRNQSAAEFRAWLRDERVTIYHSVPSLFRLLSMEDETYPDVRLIRLEGDQASSRDVGIFKQHFGPECRLVNGLGTTETGLVSQYFLEHDSQLPRGTIPVGFTVPDMRVRILDGENRPVASGEVGQIAVESEFLANGYWNDPQRTTAAFTTTASNDESRTYLTGDLGRIDENGALVHLGRVEGQVRLRGHTLQLSDIEAAVESISGIAQAVVIISDGESDREGLVAYFVPAGDSSPSVSVIRKQLAEELPGHAIPSRFIELATLPLSANGKIDRSALPSPQSCRPNLDTAFTPPRSLLQLQIADIWERVLGTGGIGIHDDFFDLGGHSFLALRMLLDVEREFGVEIDGSSLLTAATIEKLERLILTRERRFKETVVELHRVHGQAPFVFLHGDYNSGGLYCINLAKHLDEKVPLVVMSPLSMDESEREYSFEAMAAHYVSELRRIQPQGPYFLGGTCNGGMVAYEMARQLRESGEDIALLALFYASAGNLKFRSLRSAVDRVGRVFRFSAKQKSAVFFRLREISQNLSRANGTGKVAYVIQKIVAIPRTVRQLLRPPDNPLAERNEADNVYSHYRFLDDIYVPGKFDGKVNLIWPSGEPQSANEAAAWWRQVASDVEVTALDSDHYGSLTSQVHLLAGALSDHNTAARASARPCPKARPRPSAE